MKQRSEIILAGSGGQGLIFSGVLLAETAIMEGKNVVQTQTYGIAQRGGFSAAEVIIDENEILYQQVLQPDVIVALDTVVLNKFKDASGPVLYDSSLIQNEVPAAWIGIPFTQIADDLGNKKMTNLVAVGALLAITPIVSLESLQTMIASKFSAPLAERNFSAVLEGMKAVTEYRERK